MSDRKEKINKEIEKEKETIRELEQKIEEMQSELDKWIALENKFRALPLRIRIEELELDKKREEARVAGKEAVRDKPDKKSTADLIEEEKVELKKKRQRRKELRAKKKLTSEEKNQLDHLEIEIAIESAKIEGKKKAGRVVGEIAMAPLEQPGQYKVAVFDPLGREIVAFLLPDPAAEVPMISDIDKDAVVLDEMVQHTQHQPTMTTSKRSG